MKFLASFIPACALAVCAAIPATLSAQAPAQASASTQRASDADLIDLADYADLVVRAKVRRQSDVAPERAPGLRPGYARYYIEADTQNLIAGNTPLGERVRSLHSEFGLTTVMVTHDMAEALLLADRVLVMDGGAIVADETPHSLLEGAGGEIAQGLVAVPRAQADRLAELAR